MSTLADLVEDAANVRRRRGHVEPDDDGYLPDEVVTELAFVAQAGLCGDCPGR